MESPSDSEIATRSKRKGLLDHVIIDSGDPWDWSRSWRSSPSALQGSDRSHAFPSMSNTQTAAVIDIGASAVRLVVAQLTHDKRPVVLEEASRGVLLGQDTFSSGRIGAVTIDAAVRALDGFRHIMDGYEVSHIRAVATSAVREAANADTFLDRVRVRTGLDVEIIDGSEESRLTYLAVREGLQNHAVLSVAHAVLVEVGGGSVDLT